MMFARAIKISTDEQIPPQININICSKMAFATGGRLPFQPFELNS